MELVDFILWYGFPSLTVLFKHISIFTQLKFKAHYNSQLLMFSQHHDYSEEGVDFGTGNGNRIATVLFYVNVNFYIYIAINNIFYLAKRC